MNLRFFVYPNPRGPASDNFDTLTAAIIDTTDPAVGAVIAQGARAEPSGPAPGDVTMAVCSGAGVWTLTDDGQEERGTWKLVRNGLARVEDERVAATAVGDAE